MTFSIQALHGMIYDIITSSWQEPCDAEMQAEHATDAILRIIKEDRSVRETVHEEN